MWELAWKVGWAQESDSATQFEPVVIIMSDSIFDLVRNQSFDLLAKLLEQGLELDSLQVLAAHCTGPINLPG